MKKILTTLFLIAGSYSLSFAQNFAQANNGVEFGVNVGYNASYLTENLNSTSVASGFNFGISADFPLSESWGIKAKVIYDQKGWGDGFLTTSTGATITDVNYRLNYITIPLLASWHFGWTKNWYVNFGPYVGLLMSASETTDNIDVKSSFNSTDEGLALGVGVKFPISDNVKLFIETDGQSGLVNVFKDSNGAIYQNVRSSINVGLNFR